jgi:biotin/methionine sulfoxide reductase
MFADLAQRLGVGEAFTEGRDSSQWLRYLYDRFRQEANVEGIDVPEFEELCAQNWVELPIAGSQHVEVPFAAFRENPDAAPLGTPSGRIEIFSETIDSFGYDDCPGHPTWLAPEEWLGADLAEQFPLHLVSPQPGDKLHSQMECAIADIAGARPTAVEINIKDASDRGITDSDLVRVFNDRGACQARAHISNDIRPGVVALPTGAWYDPASDGTDTQGNPNLLTRDRGTSRLGQGSSAHTTLVEIEPWNSE